ncbi:hypothetical protein OHA72_14325 [Dactylosporangium sp. NBC_01737]|uniref:hypothetical protein n=1 Tax=Dactylosporangium sp. NBC_01737 TaxID=2975959 RepID=UPI002E0DDADD|nr:hypothetical protein OHA72_14325 [Dactylosporangium sp. NBC_01737]
MRRLTRPAAGAVPVRSIAAAGVPAADRFATLVGASSAISRRRAPDVRRLTGSGAGPAAGVLPTPRSAGNASRGAARMRHLTRQSARHLPGPLPGCRPGPAAGRPAGAGTRDRGGLS